LVDVKKLSIAVVADRHHYSKTEYFVEDISTAEDTTLEQIHARDRDIHDRYNKLNVGSFRLLAQFLIVNALALV
jgi:hypothetical protein